MKILLLGPVEVTSNGDPVALGGPKERALLALLALRAGEAVSADELIDGLWGGEPPATALKLVQQYVSHVRKALASAGQGELIVTHGRGYELRVAREQVDVGRFERLLAQGAAREALTLWRGRPLADIDGEPFAAGEVRRLEEMRTVALELAIDQDLRAGRHQVLAEIEGLLAHEPLRERLHALRMLALYRSGRQAEALEAYREARAVLIEEVGIEPGPELRRMQEAILRQDPSLHPPPDTEFPTREEALERLGDAAGRAAAGRAGWRVAEDDVAAGVVELQAQRERETGEPTWSGSPFKGLASFNIDDAGVFFGRERLVAELVARVPGSRLMGIVGPSGSGKSSALRAGLLAALADGVLPGSEDWPIMVIRPGRHPVQALDELSPGGRCVLAVDQFEETFTLCDDEAERSRFVAALLRCARDPQGPLLVALAIRADYYGRCAAYPELSRALGVNHALVGPMHREELRRAIELPARRAGLALEPALTDALVADVAGEPGGLPLLSTALLELSADELTLAAYGRSGGVHGAVARLAEGAYERLDPDGRERARQILLRLSGDGDARARVPIAELDAGDLLDTLATERLVALGDGEAELAHEALLREWPRLRGWVEEDAEGRRLHRHLAQSAREWNTGGRDPAELYRGTRLGAALDWSADRGDELNAAEQEFLDASRAAAEQAAERDRRANRRLRALLAGAAVLLGAAVVAGVLALSQREQAQDAALSADAQRLGAGAVANDRLDQAVLLARAGVHLDASVATHGNLLTVLMRQPSALGELRGDGWPLYSLAVDGSLLAIGDERGGVTVYDARTRRRISRHLMPEQLLVQHLRFMPDAASLAAVSHGDDGITRIDLIDPRTGRRIRRIELPAFPEKVFYVTAFTELDPDGSHLVALQSDVEFETGAPAVLRRVNLRTGESERSRRIGGSGARYVVATADRRRLFVTVAGDDRTYEIDPETLAVRREWPDGDLVGAVTPDGRYFALGGDAGRVRLLDLETGRSRRFDGSHEDGEDMRMVFTPDGRTLVTSAGPEGEVIVWDVAGGRIRERPSGHTELVNVPATSPDGRTLYTAGVDSKVTLWDLAGDRRLDRRFPVGPVMDFDNGSPKGLAVSPDGGTVAVTQKDGSVELRDARTLTMRRSAQVLDGAALAVTFSAHGELLAVAGEGEQVLLRDARTLAPVRELRAQRAAFVQGLAISPDGRRVAAATIPKGRGAPGRSRLHIWDVRTGRAVGRQIDIVAVDLAFSPDSRFLAAAALNDDSAVFAAADGREVTAFRTGDDGRSIAFSPDGSLLAVGQYGGSTVLFSTSAWKPVGRTLEGHRARITALEFSPDGRRLLTGGADGTLRLWDTASRQPIGSALEVEPDAYVAAGFAAGGSRVIAVPHFGRAVSWDVRPAAWERHACLVAGRELTAREWRDALPERAQQPVC